MDNNPIAIIFSILVSFLTMLGIGGQGNNSAQEKSFSPEKIFNVDFVSESTQWKIDAKQSVTIAFDTVPTPYPTAVDLVIEFTPADIEVVDIAGGDLWTGVNVLKKEIDNKNGQVRFVIGQGFGAKIGNNTKIATLSIVPKKASKNSTIIKIGAGSKAASAGKKSAISIEGNSLTLSISK